jgi:hypothetical protein
MLKNASYGVKALAANMMASFPSPSRAEVEAEFLEVTAKLVEFLKQKPLTLQKNNGVRRPYSNCWPDLADEQRKSR